MPAARIRAVPLPPPVVDAEISKGDLTEEQLAYYLATPAVSIDTETLGLNLLRDRLCVVQLCDRAGRATLVQVPRVEGSTVPPPEPPERSRSPRLKRLMEAPDVLKVFHFARFDVAALRHNLGIHVAPLYCTRTASKLIRTYTDRHGLKDLALALLDVELDKTAQRTDWAAPELRPEQVRYAIGDVTLLIPLMDRLNEMLDRENRRDLAEECFRAIPVISRLDLMEYVDLFEH
jgi:ribonuclease D